MMPEIPLVRSYKEFDHYFQDWPHWPIESVFERVAALMAEGMERSEAHRQAHLEGPPPRGKRWEVTIFNSVMDKTGKQLSIEWGSLRELLTVFFAMPTNSKLMARAWSPASFRGSRASKNVDKISALVFNFDDGTRIEHVRETLQLVPHFGHTSWSHTEDHHRFRVVMPLYKPVSGRVWKQVYRWAINLWEETKPLEAGSPDRACSDPSRLYLVPAYRKGYARDSWVNKDPEWAPGSGYLDIPADVQREKPAPPKPKRIKREIGSGQLERAARKRAKTDPRTRENIAHAIGASIRDGMARRIRCPQCNRQSVWYGIDAEQSTSARCNHANSCGWWGSVYDLAIQNGMTL